MTYTTPKHDPSADLHARVENDFTLHPPKHEHIGSVMDGLREDFRDLAHTVIDRCPPSRELSMALTNLDDGLKNAIAAVARNQDEVLARDYVEHGGEAEPE